MATTQMEITDESRPARVWVPCPLNQHLRTTIDLSALDQYGVRRLAMEESIKPDEVPTAIVRLTNPHLSNFASEYDSTIDHLLWQGWGTPMPSLALLLAALQLEVRAAENCIDGVPGQVSILVWQAHSCSYLPVLIPAGVYSAS